MTPEIEERKRVRKSTKGLRVNGLPYRLALLEVGGVHLEETTLKGVSKIRNRVNLAPNSKALQHYEFSIKVLHCRDLANPADESFIIRIQRDK